MASVSGGSSSSSAVDVDMDMDVPPDLVCPIPLAIWPDDAPHEGADAFMSVIATASQCRWAIHNQSPESLCPVESWSTDACFPYEDIAECDPCEMMQRYFPIEALQLFYGNEVHAVDINREEAYKHRATCRIPDVSVYCIFPTVDGERSEDTMASVQVIESAIEFILRDVPCSLFKLDAAHFTNHESDQQHPIELLACAKAVENKCPGQNCLVIDGSYCMTMTTLAPRSEIGVEVSDSDKDDECGEYARAEPNDSNEANSPMCNLELAPPPSISTVSIPRDRVSMDSSSLEIIESTRSVSIVGKLRTMHEQTGALPLLDSGMTYNIMKKRSLEKRALKVFSTNTQDSMLSCVIQETTLLVRSVIKSWVRSIRSSVNASNSEPPAVLLAGTDCEVLGFALGFRGSPVIETFEDDELTWGPPKPARDQRDLIVRSGCSEDEHTTVSVRMLAPLVFFGVGYSVLDAQNHRSDLARSGSVEEFFNQISGCRVAKRFEDSEVYRGHIIAAVRVSNFNNTLFNVRYDDGDREDYDVVDLYDHLILYGKEGEPKEILYESYKQDKIKKKKEDSLIAAKSLKRLSSEVSRQVDKKRKRSNQADITPVDQGETGQRFPTGNLLNITPNCEAPVEDASDTNPDPFIGQHVAQYFGRDLYEGVVSERHDEEYDEIKWSVLFEDNEVYDYNASEIEELIEIYKRDVLVG